MISLIMATVGRVDEFRRAIDSLAAQTDKDFELIVVDQNGDDRLVAIIDSGRQRGLDITHDRFAIRNLSAARNRGLELARHACVAYPDDDCWYEPDVARRVNDFFRAHADYAGVVGRWPEEGLADPPEQDFQFAQWRRLRIISSASFTIYLRRSAIDAVGGFDDRLGVSCWYGAGEETDLLYRILEWGGKIRYRPDIAIHHPEQPPSPVGPLGKVCQNARRRGRGSGALYVKHRLPAGVIARGLVAPLVKPWRRPWDMRGIAVGGAEWLGRVEGLIRWYFKEQ